MGLPRGVNALLSALLLLLVIGLAVLAVLQYRWIDQVSTAEHDRMRANIDFAARRFTSDLRAELGDLFETFARPEGGDIGQRYDNWARSAAHPRLAASIHVIEEREEAWVVRRLDLETLDLVDAEWPRALDKVRRDIEEQQMSGRRVIWPPPFMAEVPGLFLSPRRGGPPERRPFDGPFDDPPLFERPHHPPAIFIQLDREELAGAILPELAKRHFSAGTESYSVAVLDRSDVLYRSDASWPDGRSPADVELKFVAFEPPARRGPAPPFTNDEPWRLLVRRRDGGLQTLVDAARRRNLAISFGILFILAATVLLLLALLRRADRLRAQQTQFVAAMSHELNTPIAALRSAGENLKDGIVADPEKLSRYGETIVKESARLGAMVAQVLEFAGMQSRVSRPSHEAIDVSAILEEAVAQCRWIASDVDIETRVDDNLPVVHGDADSLTRAIQNLIANAIRHGGSGKWVGVHASRERSGVTITVEDRGPGIDSRDAAHLFEPFYRGRASNRVRGAGLGLAIVQQIARAHGGSVEIDKRRRNGAAFNIHLPAGVQHA